MKANHPAQRLLLTAMLTVAAALLASTAHAAVSVPNGSFEVGGGGWPDDWAVGTSGGDGHIGWDSGGVASDGDRSIALRVENNVSTADTHSITFAATPGETLYLWFDYRLEQNANLTLTGTPRFQFRFWDDAARSNFQGELNILLTTAVTPGSPANPGDWLTAMGSIVVPAGAGFADFSISASVFEDFEGTARFDNIVVLDSLPVPAPAALPAGLAMLGLAAARRRRRN